MYREYFGLEQEPFRASIGGPGVYVGSLQATAISRLEKALAKPDSVAMVAGPVGVGKTTLVSRALEVTLPQARVARIERIRLGPDEVVELLLAKFGVSRQPQGTIQRFATFKRLLDECSDDGTPAVIVVEDARRLGIDALVELEAMTAADGGDSGCANIVLMGDAGLPSLLADPQLVRLGQRLRTRQTLRPFSADELRDYLKYCLQQAGGEFDAIFESGSVSMLHQCSDGIPRIVNNICETALSEAADAGARRVTVELLRDIARDVYAIDTLPPELVDGRAGEEATDAAETDGTGEDDLEPGERFASAGEFAAPAPASGDGSTAKDTPLADDGPWRVEDVGDPTMLSADDAHAATDVADDRIAAEARLGDRADDDPGGRAASGVLETEPDAMPASAVAESQLAVPAIEPSAPAAAVEEELTVSEFTPNPAITIVDSRRVAAMAPPRARVDAPDEQADGETENREQRVHDRTATSLASMPATAGEASANDPESHEDTLDSDADTHEVPILDNTAAVLKLDSESEELGDDDIPVLTDSAGIESVAACDEQAAEEPEPQRDESGVDTMTPEAEELTAALDELEQAISSANQEDVAWRAQDAPGEDRSAPDRSPDDQESSGSEMSRWQEELANAKSLDQMSDMLAETVFGDREFDRIAAEAVAQPPAAADDAGGPEWVEPEEEPVPAATDTGPAAPGAERGHGRGATGGFEMSMSQRFELLRSFEKRAQDRNGVEITLGEGDDAVVSSGEAPETIESQIDTAITQSRMQLKPADIGKMKKDEAPRDDDKQPAGFFGLFKRSSKS